MSTILFITFIGPISWFYHPQVHDELGRCTAAPGSYRALWCAPTDILTPAPVKPEPLL